MSIDVLLYDEPFIAFGRHLRNFGAIRGRSVRIEKDGVGFARNVISHKPGFGTAQ